MLRKSPASYRHEPFCPQRPCTPLELIARWILGGGGIVHAAKFGRQAVAGYMRHPIAPQPIPSRIYMQRDASTFAVGAEL
jgi:hypothetical protein